MNTQTPYRKDWQGEFNSEARPIINDVSDETRQAALDRIEQVKNESHKQIFGED